MVTQELMGDFFRRTLDAERVIEARIKRDGRLSLNLAFDAAPREDGPWHTNPLDRLERFTRRLGLDITDNRPAWTPREVLGLYMPEWRVIWLADLSREKRFSVLLHELTHAISMAERGAKYSRRDYHVEEVIAEATSAMVSSRYLTPISDDSPVYVAYHATCLGGVGVALREAAPRIIRASGILEAALEGTRRDH